MCVKRTVGGGGGVWNMPRKRRKMRCCGAMDIQFDRCEKPRRTNSMTRPLSPGRRERLGIELTINGPSRQCFSHLAPGAALAIGPQNAPLADAKARVG